jgi:transposase
LPASSGKQQRHRLNRTGNRRLNRALYIIAITQARIHPPARDYIARRVSEGKTAREALRALKRFIARRLYRILTTELLDLTAPRPITGTAPLRCL